MQYLPKFFGEKNIAFSGQLQRRDGKINACNCRERDNISFFSLEMFIQTFKLQRSVSKNRSEVDIHCNIQQYYSFLKDDSGRTPFEVRDMLPPSCNNQTPMSPTFTSCSLTQPPFHQIHHRPSSVPKFYLEKYPIN